MKCFRCGEELGEWYIEKFGVHFCFECYNAIKDDIKKVIECLEKEY